MDYRKSLLLFLEKQEYSPSLSFADIKPWIKKSKITDFDLSHLLINMSSERENLIQGCGIVWMRCFIPLPNGKLNKISETDFLFKITPNGQKWIDEIQIRKKLLFDKRISRISVGIAISSLLLSIWIWNKAD